MEPSTSLAERVLAARQRLIVALDLPDAAQALAMVDRLEDSCIWLKVGLELFTAAGPAFVEQLTHRGKRVFLDLKFHDIPNTVAAAVRSAASLGAQMLTVHASGGSAMLEAAHQALQGLQSPPELLAVTVLTSMDAAQLASAGLSRPAHEQVELLAKTGLAAGIRGFVCSPEEVQTLRLLTGPDGILVIPGVRPSGAPLGDQKRIATPAQALARGASFLVVGRPITQSPDPLTATRRILAEMAQAL